MSEKARKSEQKNKIQKSNAKSTFTKSIKLKTKRAKGTIFYKQTNSTQQYCTFSVLLCRTRSKKRTIQQQKMDGGAHVKRTILIPKCSNRDEDDGNGSKICFFVYIISKVLTK